MSRIAVENDEVTLEVKIKLSGSMLNIEQNIQDVANEVGNILTREALKRFDTEGSPIIANNTKWTSIGQISKTYRTKAPNTRRP